MATPRQNTPVMQIPHWNNFVAAGGPPAPPGPTQGTTRYTFNGMPISGAALTQMVNAAQSPMTLTTPQPTNLSYYNQFDPNEYVPDAYTLSGGGQLPITGFAGAGSWYNAGII